MHSIHIPPMDTPGHRGAWVQIVRSVVNLAKHNCRRICVWCFMQSLAFPIEHVLWERAPVLSSITRLLGV